jgi:hypothetical protein
MSSSISSLRHANVTPCHLPAAYFGISVATYPYSYAVVALANDSVISLLQILFDVE